MATIGKIIVGVGLFLGSLFGYHQNVAQVQQPIVGDYNPAGGGTYRLQSSVGSSDTTITLSSFKEPVSNIAYTMSYLNSTIEYGTLEPGNSSKKEFISFSGITQNGDGTATLTGVTRGLSFAYPYTASTTLQQTHSGQSIFILSNPPQLTNQYGNLNNANTWLAVNTFTSGANPKYNTVPVTFGSNDLVPYQTLLNTSIQGAATSTETNMGIVQLATQTQLNANTASSTEGRPLVIPNKLATSTCQFAQGATLISSSTTGKLGGNCVDTTYSYTFSGGNTFNGSTTFNATTSIPASNVNSNPLKLNGVPYKFPSTQGASSTVFLNDGNGNLISSLQDWTLLSATTSDASLGSATTTITGTPQDILIIISSPNAISGGATNANLIINSDGASDYGAAVTYMAGTSVGTGDSYTQSAQAQLTLLGATVSTTTPFLSEIRIKNISSKVKIFQWRNTYYSASTLAPTYAVGSGIWNNTSNAISNIVLRAGNGSGGTFNFPAGLNIQVYGGKN